MATFSPLRLPSISCTFAATRGRSVRRSGGGHPTRGLVASFLGLLAVGTRAEAATVVVNVNSVARLYQAFITADANPANVYETGRISS